MDHAAFVADPKGYLRGQTVEVGNRNARLAMAMGTPWITVAPSVAANNGGRGSSLCTHLRTLKCDFNHMGPGVLHELRRGTAHGGLTEGFDRAQKSFLARDKRIVRIVDEGTLAAPDNGFRFLPFEEDQVMYMELDANATFAMTGPLTGCTVAVGRGTAGRLWFFHANENHAANGYAARQSQRLSIYAVLGGLGITQAGVQMCLYGNTHFGYNGMGFVWGRRRPGGTWKFYSHYEQPGGRSNLKWAEI